MRAKDGKKKEGHGGEGERKKEYKHRSKGVGTAEGSNSFFTTATEEIGRGAENYEAQVCVATLLKNKKPHHFRRLS